ncbi:S-adenosyl-L-methionine-dependent tRNA 4-demethylwyosine synthase-like [Selaginella moellendorffii]|uniref:S-adenosyl-L-methionine-dependent tRNA 4-demethylwyosine synthase-like n=1 Tax=Selaginella moellendorffii TaxID=88036 RepID=UPI000D1CE3EB|nr:S-adenosyl-L-methionine-dependent tRNA 4-demethylwyosine synthase-like [Selaginella moellendorffii]XP_024536840.1 S-adenosyl-L-methionine-dependent tRNA 4-demethylwyosine synthase-like [Selaginella moellendorffii]|eukprot:XP_024536839.1 S-adenosyl-L-methionine-dependent tRNA 4-demethylwyosine synthase-like [Selaginella moellendorffii]
MEKLRGWLTGGADRGAGDCSCKGECNSNDDGVGGGGAVKLKLLFASETGTSAALAKRLAGKLGERGIPVELVDPSGYEPEEFLKERLVVMVVSTWEDGNPPKHAAFFVNWLAESSTDFRVGSKALAECRFAVFGVGSREYGSKFNAVGRAVEKYMADLGAQRLVERGEGDVDGGRLDATFDGWSARLVRKVKEFLERDSIAVEPAAAVEGDESDDDDEFDDSKEDFDLEDLAGKYPRATNGKLVSDGEAKEMVTPVIRSSLEKQGYKVIGSHSGVKLCRWTKSQLRGRGGCYKHTFYGIESHRCMEATPSLACANKCVFCWRHHTNPVGKSWKWKMDDPLDIVTTALDHHKKMIKQMKGVPGVKDDRLEEGLRPRHCALSLVGEPIMYPEINTLVDELHKRHISTFLVTNAQFPDKIASLHPVTQLYVSVDAATKERLKAIDRPLFSDYWERFIDSLKALLDKQQRTVYRLTLVKGWNTAEITAYAELLKLGRPDFIEIKGVTYCGSSKTSTLTMENVPWHEDVREFSEALSAETRGEYELACEHVHSCCVLLANVSKFKADGQWHTWIDYDKFQELVTSGESFSSEDYMATTPAWAVYGAVEGGFDPTETRVRKERRHGGGGVSGGCT